MSNKIKIKVQTNFENQKFTWMDEVRDDDR